MAYCLAVKWTIKKGELDAVLAALRPLTEASRQEPGCLLYQANRSRENRDHFLLVEHYRDEAALEAHRQTPHFQRLIEGTCIPLLERRERELYDLIAG